MTIYTRHRFNSNAFERLIAFPPFGGEGLGYNTEGDVLVNVTADGVDVNALELERVADIRYSQQINQVAVNAPAGDYDSGLVDELVGRFEDEYERLFGAGSGYAAAGFVLYFLRFNQYT